MRAFLLFGAAGAQAVAGAGELGGTADFRGDEGETTAYGGNDREGVVNTNLNAPVGDTNLDGTQFKPWDTTNTRESVVSDTTPGCDGAGFVCDFKEIAKMKVKDRNYEPLDFIWKVVDPAQRYVDGYLQQTLPCEIRIDYDTAKAGNMVNSFRVPMGEHNTGSTDYCDIEQIRRDFADEELYMNDTIHIRGEVARLTNSDDSHYDLIGEQYDLICGCMTKLSTEVDLDLKASTTMQYMMASTGTSRTLPVTLKIFSDDLLENEVKFPQPFPDDAGFFYFLAHHDKTNDWDARLQINKCIACDSTATCSTLDNDVLNDEKFEVIFWEQCATILGGPSLREVDMDVSWMSGGSVAPTGVPTAINSEWAPGRVATEDDTTPMPSTCPYYAFGVSKFRLQGVSDSTAAPGNMKITCAVTACSKLPCKPCTARRLSFGQRALQAQDEGEEVEIAMYMAVPGGAPVMGGDNESSSASSKKRGAFFIALICVILLCVAAGIYIATRQAKKRTEATKARTVEVSSKVEA